MKDKYFELLKEKYNTPESVYTELMNLEAIQNLPKGTELYLSDVHGASKEFKHILKTGSGNVREKIENFYGDSWNEEEKNQFSLLISYPKKVLSSMQASEKTDSWYYQTITHLIDFIGFCAAKYTRSKLRKALPKKYRYIIEELLYTDPSSHKDRNDYYDSILNRLIELKQAERFIVSLCGVIPRLVIDHLHLVGDIFDRSGGEYTVMKELMQHHSVDIQWGNHDVLWLGAMHGSKANLLTLLRIAARYGYLYDLEKTYGLNLRPLFLYAENHYAEHAAFKPKLTSGTERIFNKEKESLLNRVHQALAIMQFKLEGQLIERRPEFDMDWRNILKAIDFEKGRITIEGKTYSLDAFPYDSIDKHAPNQLNADETYIVETLLASFQQAEKMRRINKFLLRKGSMYLVYNDQLLYHGCIPLKENGEFACLRLKEKDLKGKELLDFFEYHIKKAAEHPEKQEDFSTDLEWYAWAGPLSPLFGRNKMTTFERYYIENEETYKEERDPYFDLRNEEDTADAILREFGLNPEKSKIINGHTPVKVKKGEEPVKAGGKVFVIDGGMNAAYQKTTGIAGYSLLNNSYGFQLVTHQTFDTRDNLLGEKSKEATLKRMIDKKLERKLIKNTTIGRSIQAQIEDLQSLISYVNDD
ncbi:Fructose-1,6-bisphosphatase [Alkalibacterium sp. AK22]|uniref:fructose-bisphosphatase class III n=1 Tax=Alkalibacterium sp. AK22 TaxID=1229520 RepID=UPI00044A43A3|nr:fructose-bisphosphatase class III [Alkalibacterium sp. AK22]EXJ23900.1 Fructose-1,6-bisphosphatase [Alkalibacterium sp. AK22]